MLTMDDDGRIGRAYRDGMSSRKIARRFIICGRRFGKFCGANLSHGSTRRSYCQLLWPERI